MFNGGFEGSIPNRLEAVLTFHHTLLIYMLLVTVRQYKPQCFSFITSVRLI